MKSWKLTKEIDQNIEVVWDFYMNDCYDKDHMQIMDLQILDNIKENIGPKKVGAIYKQRYKSGTDKIPFYPEIEQLENATNYKKMTVSWTIDYLFDAKATYELTPVAEDKTLLTYTCYAQPLVLSARLATISWIRRKHMNKYLNFVNDHTKRNSTKMLQYKKMINLEQNITDLFTHFNVDHFEKTILQIQSNVEAIEPIEIKKEFSKNKYHAIVIDQNNQKQDVEIKIVRFYDDTELKMIGLKYKTEKYIIAQYYEFLILDHKVRFICNVGIKPRDGFLKYDIDQKWLEQNVEKTIDNFKKLVQ